MRTKTCIKVGLLLLLFNTLAVINVFTQGIPLVYDVENTGVDCTQPPLPDLSSLPVVAPLPDPFVWANGSGRSTAFKDWEHHRNEIAAQIEHYEIGTKPPRPDTISASFSKSDSILTVNITRNGKSMTLTALVILPDTGSGPFPAVIGVAFGSPILPDSMFKDRGIATIAYQHNQVSTYGQAPSSSDPYYQLYPELLGHSGQYSAWAWGVSRIIDGLELTQDSLPIDLHHIGVSGCSYAGKLALFAGAFDERIALTIAIESGGGGATSWRYSEILGNVETLGATDHKWFRPEMFQFAGSNVSRLPEDHHELMAMVAPRALFVTGNPGWVWLANPSCYVCSRACQKVYDTLGIPDRFGFSLIGGHYHCAIPDAQFPQFGAFLDKFLLGDTTANTNVTSNPYTLIDYNAWTKWWGTGNPVFPSRDANGAETVEIEPECATVGSDWTIKAGDQSSVGYVLDKDSISTSQPPTDSASTIYMPFTLTTDSTFYVFERSACADTASDSYWFKMDNGTYIKRDGLSNGGVWRWDTLGSYHLTAGNHTLAVAYCQNNAYFDKICISSYAYIPIGTGDTAVNTCVPAVTPPPPPPSSGLSLVTSTEGYALGQNYPNPTSGNTTIAFVIPNDTYVSLKVYSMLGAEVEELAGKEYTAGKHTVEFDTRNLSKGVYFYTLKAEGYLETRKMILQNK